MVVRVFRIVGRSCLPSTTVISSPPSQGCTGYALGSLVRDVDGRDGPLAIDHTQCTYTQYTHCLTGRQPPAPVGLLPSRQCTQDSSRNFVCTPHPGVIPCRCAPEWLFALLWTTRTGKRRTGSVACEVIEVGQPGCIDRPLPGLQGWRRWARRERGGSGTSQRLPDALASPYHQGNRDKGSASPRLARQPDLACCHS